MGREAANLYALVDSREAEKKQLSFFLRKKTFKNRKCATTKRLLRWSWTMDPECARPASPVMTLLAPSSLPSSVAHVTSVSWSAWDRKMPTLVTRLSPREVSSP